MPPLPRETMQRILEMIRHDVAEDKVKIDTPTQNLESYFPRGRAKSPPRRSGDFRGHFRQSGGSVFAGQCEQGSASAKILERLTQPVETTRADTPEAAPAPAIDAAKLEALTRPEESSAPLDPASTPQKEPDLAKANEKLSSLLGKPKQP